MRIGFCDYREFSAGLTAQASSGQKPMAHSPTPIGTMASRTTTTATAAAKSVWRSDLVMACGTICRAMGSLDSLCASIVHLKRRNLPRHPPRLSILATILSLVSVLCRVSSSRPDIIDNNWYIALMPVQLTLFVMPLFQELVARAALIILVYWWFLP